MCGNWSAPFVLYTNGGAFFKASDEDEDNAAAGFWEQFRCAHVADDGQVSPASTWWLAAGGGDWESVSCLSVVFDGRQALFEKACGDSD